MFKSFSNKFRLSLLILFSLLTLTMPFLLWICGEPWPVIAMSLVTLILICFRHKENIQRLIRGEENSWKKKDG